MKVLFLFIDGVGLRAPAPDNPVRPEVCPVLCSLIEKHSVAIDACLAVDGLPQSATMHIRSAEPFALAENASCDAQAMPVLDLSVSATADGAPLSLDPDGTALLPPAAVPAGGVLRVRLELG